MSLDALPEQNKPLQIFKRECYIHRVDLHKHPFTNPPPELEGATVKWVCYECEPDKKGNE